jgi:4-hydroxybenzoate polyprenyltransferase
VTENGPTERGSAQELGRFLEIQNLGLNLAFALAFLLVAAGGLPSLRTLILVVVAFVAARNAGHSFNRWTDRVQDRRNPRTQDRALVTGRLTSAFAIGFAAVNAALVVVAAALLNPLALYLSPVALALVFGYSYTKRYGWWTTAFLGLVQSITPAAAYVAVRGTIPLEAFVAVLGMLLWGTAFETIHSLGDVDSDRALGLRSIPVRLGVAPSVRLIPVLHAAALVAFAAYGWLAGLAYPYDIAIAAMALLAARTDLAIHREPGRVLAPFRSHFALGAIFLLGTGVALFAMPWLPVP